MDPAFEQAQRMGSMWLEFMTKLATAGVQFKPDQGPPEAARAVRQATLRAMGEHADRYMRSPQFLDMIKQSLDTTIATRKQFNEMLTHAHHSAQSVAKQDIDALLQAVRHLETRLLDRIETLTERVEQLEHAMNEKPVDAAPKPGME